MKILFYGAGSLASLLASRLIAGGQDVTMLARGKRLEDLRRSGLVLCDLVSGDCSHTPVTVVESLGPLESYDLIVVLMGKHYLPGVLPALAANQACPHVLFMGNNAAGPDELAAAVGKERLLLGFFGAAGKIDDDIAYYATQIGKTSARMILGDPYDGITLQMEAIAKELEASGFPVERTENINAYLKTHVAAILPVGCAYYLAGRSLDQLAATPDAQVVMLRGMREAMAVLRKLNIPIIPAQSNLIMRLPEPLMMAVMHKRLTAPGVRLGAIHVDGMHNELLCLAEEFAELKRHAGIATPNLDRLMAALSPTVPPIPYGSAGLKLDWRGIWAALAALSAMIALVFGVSRRKRQR